MTGLCNGEYRYHRSSCSSSRRRVLVDIELAFRKAWLFLYTRGVGADYLDALDKFVRAVVVAYRSGYSIDRLKLELLANRRLTGNTEVDKNLALNEEELSVRDLWLRLVYLTLEAVKEPGPETRISLDNPSEDDTGVQLLVNGVIRAFNNGYTLESFKLEMILDGARVEDPQQSALLSQWMRIIFMALQVHSEK
jgi:hypothetical protein